MTFRSGQSTASGSSSAESTSLYEGPQVALDVDNYPRAPLELELEQVHIYVRHGERTPVGVRMAEPPASIPEHWMLCKTARRFRAAVASSHIPSSVSISNNGREEELEIRKIVERSDGTNAEGECLLGELTDIGRKSTYNFGAALRNLYVNKLGFLTDTNQAMEEAYFRSTNMPRTIESLQQIVYGLYPPSSAGFVPRIYIRNGKDENLLGNTFACKRLETLQIGFAHAAAAAWNQALEPLDRKVSKYIGGNPLRLDGKPRASGVLDTVRAAVAHGIKVPPEFEEKSVIDVIEKAVVHEWFADKTEEVRRLGMGRLLSDLTGKMQHRMDHGPADPLKILVHSTHDTAIAAICQTLDVFDDKWPAFTAAITFELFRKRGEKAQPQSYLQSVLGGLSSAPQSKFSQHYVRMRYQNKNMVLPLCAEEGKHLPGSPELCTFAAFSERVKELTAIDWETECLR